MPVSKLSKRRTLILTRLVTAISLAGCGDLPPAAEEESTSGVWRFDERTYVGSHGEQVCSELRWEQAGKSTVVEREFYHLDVINDVLDGSVRSDDGVRAAVLSAGLERVASCEDARRFMRLQNEYLESQPGDPPVAPAAESPSSGPAEPPAEDTVIDKIAGGRPWYDPATVRINMPHATLDSDTPREFHCSGVLINAAMLLTAAHCFPADGNYRLTVNYGTAKLDGSGNRICINQGGCNPPAGSNMVVWRFPGYAGIRDTARDLAIVFHNKGGWRAPADTSASWLPLLESDTAGKGRWFWNVGYGHHDYNFTGAGVGRLSNQEDEIAWSTTGFWNAEVNASRGRPCAGDSGGPKINWNLIGEGLVIGIHSGSDRRPGEACPRPDELYRATKVNNKLDWIVNTTGTCGSRFSKNGWSFRRCWL